MFGLSRVKRVSRADKRDTVFTYRKVEDLHGLTYVERPLWEARLEGQEGLFCADRGV